MPTLISALGPQGATIPLLIGLSAPDVRALRVALRPIPQPLAILGLIDTGADMTAVDNNVISTVGSPLGGLTLSNLPAHGGLSPACQYNISLTVPHPLGNSKDTLTFLDWQVLELPLATLGIQAVIGRDVLAHCDFLYQGKQDRFELSW